MVNNLPNSEPQRHSACVPVKRRNISSHCCQSAFGMPQVTKVSLDSTEIFKSQIEWIFFFDKQEGIKG